MSPEDRKSKLDAVMTLAGALYDDVEGVCLKTIIWTRPGEPQPYAWQLELSRYGGICSGDSEEEAYQRFLKMWVNIARAELRHCRGVMSSDYLTFDDFARSSNLAAKIEQALRKVGSEP